MVVCLVLILHNEGVLAVQVRAGGTLGLRIPRRYFNTHRCMPMFHQGECLQPGLSLGDVLAAGPPAPPLPCILQAQVGMTPPRPNNPPPSEERVPAGVPWHRSTIDSTWWGQGEGAPCEVIMVTIVIFIIMGNS
jgi:hypothetical protein